MITMNQNQLDECVQVWRPESLAAQEFTPLSDRISRESPELAQPLEVLREKMGDKDFDKYIQNLISLKKADNLLLLITQRAMQRSLIEYMFIPALKEAFAVTHVQVVSQK